MVGSIGGPEILVILIVALLVFGPKSIPGVARTVGKGMRELRKLTTEFQREMNLADALDEDERRPAGARRPGPPDAGPVRSTQPKEQGDASADAPEAPSPAPPADPGGDGGEVPGGGDAPKS